MCVYCTVLTARCNASSLASSAESWHFPIRRRSNRFITRDVLVTALEPRFSHIFSPQDPLHARELCLLCSLHPAIVTAGVALLVHSMTSRGRVMRILSTCHRFLHSLHLFYVFYTTSPHTFKSVFSLLCWF